MKKSKLFFLCAILLTGCTVSDGPKPDSGTSPETSFRLAKWTISQAMDMAEAAANQEESKSRATFNKKSSCVQVITDKITRGTESDTLLYVVQYADNAGFAVIAAPKCVEPVLAVIDDGCYNSVETRANEPFNHALVEMENYVRAASIIGPTIPQPVPIDSYSDTIVTHNQLGPMLKTKWGQRWPQGWYCPNGLCGCVALAGAEIMSALRLPDRMAFTYQNKTTEQILDWVSLSKHAYGELGKTPSDINVNNHVSECEGNLDAHRLLADICRELGHRISADYSDSTVTSAISWSMASLLYSLTHIDYKMGHTPTDLSNEINKNNHIALVRGSDKAGGHAWVADGRREVITTINHYKLVYIPKVGTSDNRYEYRLESTETKSIPYIHYNWGWDGYCNGWFTTNIFSPDKASEYDDTSKNTGYDFSDVYTFWAF